jgi:hypothetical protein
MPQIRQALPRLNFGFPTVAYCAASTLASREYSICSLATVRESVTAFLSVLFFISILRTAMRSVEAKYLKSVFVCHFEAFARFVCFLSPCLDFALPVRVHEYAAKVPIFLVECVVVGVKCLALFAC